jgi:beta-glucosidase
MMTRIFTLWGLLLSATSICIFAAATPDHSAVKASPRKGDWMKRHEQFNQKVKANQGNIDLIFVGDSITQGWEGQGKDVWEKYYSHRKPLNLGIGGDRTQHVLWRLDNGNIEGIQPKVAVVMIGTNNSGNDRNSAGEIVDGIKAIVNKLRMKLPETKILLLAVFPRGEMFNDQRGNILQVNQVIRKLHDGEHVHFLDIGYRFIDKDGMIPRAIMPDFLHFSTPGYGVWAKAIENKLSSLLGDSPVNIPNAKINGAWTFSIGGPNGQVDSSMKLRKNGARVYGNIAMGEDREFDLLNGGIFANHMEFTIRRNRPQGGEAIYRFTGSLDGERIEGEITAEMDGGKITQEWSATKN